jgi:hypothetical protein
MLLWTAHNISTGFHTSVKVFTHLPMGRGFINQFDIRLSDPALTPIKSGSHNKVEKLLKVTINHIYAQGQGPLYRSRSIFDL